MAEKLKISFYKIKIIKVHFYEIQKNKYGIIVLPLTKIIGSAISNNTGQQSITVGWICTYVDNIRAYYKEN